MITDLLVSMLGVYIVYLLVRLLLVFARKAWRIFR